MGKKYFLLLFFLLASLVINIVAFLFLYKNRQEISSSRDFATAQQKYPLLSKRILQDFPQDILINFLDLRTQLRNEVKPYGETFGFYFEYLPTGTSIGVNEKNEFHAASLFKLPVVMAYYNQKERLRIKEDPVLTLSKDSIDKDFGNLWQKGPGYKIKLPDAIRIALEDSDNTAIKLIVPRISKKDFDNVYSALDIDLNTDQKGAIVTAKSYSSILKALYFSAVLSKDDSEEILDLLTKTKFPDKLAAGVPSNVPVAHKIGDFVDEKGNDGFRDCGIIYVPRRPYLLCMFSVSDEGIARERMQAVSKTIYDYISGVE